MIEAAYEQVSEELDELLELPAGVSREDFLRRLLRDGKLSSEIRQRFEHGKSSGKFPLLSKFWADVPVDVKKEVGEEALFRVIWGSVATPPEPPKKPWDYPPWNGDQEDYRESLYEGIALDARSDLRRLAQEWLEELLRVGYHGVRKPFGLSKQRMGGSVIPRPATPSGGAYPVFFENTRQVLWLQLDGERPLGREYKGVVVSDEPLRTDKTILAALTALEGRPIDVERLRKALAELKLPLERSMWDQWVEAWEDLPELPDYRPGKHAEYYKQRSDTMSESLNFW